VAISELQVCEGTNDGELQVCKRKAYGKLQVKGLGLIIQTNEIYPIGDSTTTNDFFGTSYPHQVKAL
jgi:hypothetical protein